MAPNARRRVDHSSGRERQQEEATKSPVLRDQRCEKVYQIIDAMRRSGQKDPLHRLRRSQMTFTWRPWHDSKSATITFLEPTLCRLNLKTKKPLNSEGIGYGILTSVESHIETDTALVRFGQNIRVLNLASILFSNDERGHETFRANRSYRIDRDCENLNCSTPLLHTYTPDQPIRS